MAESNADQRKYAVHTFTQPACPNECGNGVSRSVLHPTWHCWRCRVDAVEVEYVTLRAEAFQGAVEALEAVLPLLHGDVLDSNAIAEIEVDVRAALYRLGQVETDEEEHRASREEQ